jgi:hypothetical protein
MVPLYAFDKNGNFIPDMYIAGCDVPTVIKKGASPWGRLYPV